jgi:hypothetical protein
MSQYFVELMQFINKSRNNHKEGFEHEIKSQTHEGD